MKEHIFDGVAHSYSTQIICPKFRIFEEVGSEGEAFLAATLRETAEGFYVSPDTTYLRCMFARRFRLRPAHESTGCPHLDLQLNAKNTSKDVGSNISVNYLTFTAFPSASTANVIYRDGTAVLVVKSGALQIGWETYLLECFTVSATGRISVQGFPPLPDPAFFEV